MIHRAAKAALAPILYAQADRLKKAALKLAEPDGDRQGEVGGGALVLRLLVVGDSSAAGVGARTQDEALVVPLAAHLAARLGGLVRWQLVAQSGLTSETLLDRVRNARVDPADVAIAVCGVNDITHEVPLPHALRLRGQLADWLREQCGVRHVAFPALPEMALFPALPQPLAWYAGLLAGRNNRAQAHWAAGRDGVSHVPMDGVAESRLFCADGLHPAPALYARVAERLANHVVVVLRDQPTTH
jgi:lysophospholipase L1-like esterase